MPILGVNSEFQYGREENDSCSCNVVAEHLCWCSPDGECFDQYDGQKTDDRMFVVINEHVEWLDEWEQHTAKTAAPMSGAVARAHLINLKKDGHAHLSATAAHSTIVETIWHQACSVHHMVVFHGSLMCGSKHCPEV